MLYKFFYFINFWQHFLGHPYNLSAISFMFNVTLIYRKAKNNGKYNSYGLLSQKWIEWRNWSSVLYFMLTHLINNLLPWFKFAIESFCIVLNINSTSLVMWTYHVKLQAWHLQISFRNQISLKANNSCLPWWYTDKTDSITFFS